MIMKILASLEGVTRTKSLEKRTQMMDLLSREGQELITSVKLER